MQPERNNKEFSNNKSLDSGMIQMHLVPPWTPIIKGKYNVKSDKDFIKLKFCRYPTSNTLELYEFKMSLFDNGDLEDFFV